MNFNEMTLKELTNIDIESLPWPDRRKYNAILKAKQKEQSINENKLTKQEFVLPKRVMVVNSKIYTEAPFTVVSFYTINSGYQKEVQNLIKSLEKFKISYYIEGIESTGDWCINTHYKPNIIRRLLDLINKPIVWIDADAVVKQYPILFEAITEDFSGYFPNSDKGNDSIIRENVLSGTIYFNNTIGARNILDKWMDECINKRSEWDQHILASCMKALGNKITIKDLPPTYVKITDLMKNVGDAVIEHFQASRRHKNNDDQANTMKMALMVPSKNRPESIERLIRSAIETASYPNRIGFFVLIRKSDKATQEVLLKLQQEYSCKITTLFEDTKKEINLSRFWNEMYKEAKIQKYELFGFYGDDVEFRSNGWDSLVCTEFKRKKELPLMVRTNDNYQKEVAVLFWTNKVFHDIIGFYLPEQYKWVAMDEYLYKIASKSDSYIYLEHIDTYHHAAILGRSEQDDTFKEKRKDGAIKVRNDLQLFQTSEEQEKIQEAIRKVKNYIKFIRGD